MIKISIKPETNTDKIIYFSTSNYEYKFDLIIFIDKFGKKQTWNTKNIVNIEEEGVEQ